MKFHNIGYQRRTCHTAFRSCRPRHVSKNQVINPNFQICKILVISRYLKCPPVGFQLVGCDKIGRMERTRVFNSSGGGSQSAVIRFANEVRAGEKSKNRSRGAQ
ncbi:Uncharacterized protein Fot_36978 [Forsythia ovata]|uniref:Uncharacterized protein n=1 Tax=Forsythia ovata TaxID=205694 RepID=A0ABD1SR50_9LAMI